MSKTVEEKEGAAPIQLLGAEIVGSEFVPGAVANAEIHLMLTSLGRLTPTPGLPDYCGNSVLTAEHIEFDAMVPYIRPTTSKRYVCVFDHNGRIYSTVELSKGAQALACALHFMLREQLTQR